MALTLVEASKLSKKDDAFVDAIMKIYNNMDYWKDMPFEPIPGCSLTFSKDVKSRLTSNRREAITEGVKP